MGNCCERCFGRLDKRKYLRTRYNVERDFSIEFENLMDDDAQQEDLTNVVTASERSLLLDKRYDDLISEQKKIDKDIDEKLVRQEEELRQEEEAYYEAKREAARVARVHRKKEQSLKTSVAVVRSGPRGWVGDDESDWDVAGGEDDFEMFLENVKARSLAARTRALQSQVPMDAASETSSKDDRSRTEASSIDLEWEHEAGMMPVPKDKRKKYIPLEEAPPAGELMVKPMLLKEKQDSLSNDYEWDNDFNENSEAQEDEGEQESAKLLKSTDDECDR